MEFKCKNEECENFDKSVWEGNCTFRMIGDKLLANERFCKFCKKEMEEVKDPEGWKTVMVGEYFGSPNKNWNKPIDSTKKTIY